MENKDAGKPTKKPDALVEVMGDFKPWQFIICMWVFYSKFSNGAHCLATIFLTPTIDFKCIDPEGDDACSADCKKREYDHSVFEETIISEWDLVCGYSFLASLSQAIFMVGIMVGSMLFGIISDKYGRRFSFLACCLMHLIIAPIVTFSTWFWLFCVLRFLVAIATGGILIVSFVILMEVIGPSKREIMTLTYQLPFCLGHASLALFSYFFRHWKWYHMSISASSLLFIAYYWVIPETPRWLFSTGRLDEAIEALERAAKFNKMPTENIRAIIEEAYKAKKGGDSVKKGSLADLFRNSNLRIRTLAMAFCWLVMCLTFYGVAQYISGMLGNIFLNVAFGASLGIPGVLLCIPMTKYFGRKYTLMFSNALTGAALLTIACLPDTRGQASTILAGFGIFGAIMSFSNAYLYAGELFPTVVRNSGVGFSSLIGRIGSIVAPFVVQMSEIAVWIPPCIFGMASILAALSVLLLPETKGTVLPDTIEEGEAFGKK